MASSQPSTPSSKPIPLLPSSSNPLSKKSQRGQEKKKRSSSQFDIYDESPSPTKQLRVSVDVFQSGTFLISPEPAEEKCGKLEQTSMASFANEGLHEAQGGDGTRYGNQAGLGFAAEIDSLKQFRTSQIADNKRRDADNKRLDADNKRLDAKINQLESQVSTMLPFYENEMTILLGMLEVRERDSGSSHNSAAIAARNKVAHNPSVKLLAHTIQTKNVAWRWNQQFEDIFGCAIERARELFELDAWVKLVDARAVMVFKTDHCKAMLDQGLCLQVDNLTKGLYATDPSLRAQKIGVQGEWRDKIAQLQRDVDNKIRGL